MHVRTTAVKSEASRVIKLAVDLDGGASTLEAAKGTVLLLSYRAACRKLATGIIKIGNVGGSVFKMST